MFEDFPKRTTMTGPQIANMFREIADCQLSDMREVFREADRIHFQVMNEDGRSMALLQLIDAIAYLKFGGQWRVVKSPKPERHAASHGHLERAIYRAVGALGFFGSHRH